MRTSRTAVSVAVLALLAVASSATTLHAQERTSWTWTATGGVLNYEFADRNFSMGALRFDRPISPWVRFEFEASLARVQVQSGPDKNFAPDLPKRGSSLSTVSVGFQARYHTEWVEPYVGIAVGFFNRRDDDISAEAKGVRSSQSTLAFPAGLRVFLTDQLGLRAEVRMRRDQTAFGLSTETNWERTLGISWSFGG